MKKYQNKALLLLGMVILLGILAWGGMPRGGHTAEATRSAVVQEADGRGADLASANGQAGQEIAGRSTLGGFYEMLVAWNS